MSLVRKFAATLLGKTTLESESLFAEETKSEETHSKKKNRNRRRPRNRKRSQAQAKTPAKPQRSKVDPVGFKNLGLREEILRAVAEQGYENPSPIQAASIADLVKGRDLLGCAQTGTGKTAAFALPALQRLSQKQGSKDSPKSIRMLVLAPTRELALQVEESFRNYGRYLKLRSFVIFGGVGAEPQKRALKRGVDILVATPGRLLDLHDQGFIDLDRIELLVLDEADRMLDMGFLPDVKKILNLLPGKRQNVLFSATMPRDIEELSMRLLHDPIKVEVAPVSSTSEQVDQSLYYVDRPNKRHLLLHLLENPDTKRVLVFSRTKAIANRISKFLTQAKIGAEAIHGNKSQNARQKALENFRTGRTRVLVASDLAARGLDVDEISHVINYDLPNIAETYVHRIGRTGRASAVGQAISFCDIDEKPYVRDIEKLIGKQIPVIDDHPFPLTQTEPSKPTTRGARRGGHRNRGNKQSKPRRNGPKPRRSQ